MDRSPSIRRVHASSPYGVIDTMRKFLIAFGFLAALGLVAACTGSPSTSGSGDPAATAPSTSSPAPAASCGGSGKG